MLRIAYENRPTLFATGIGPNIFEIGIFVPSYGTPRATGGDVAGMTAADANYMVTRRRKVIDVNQST
jgi:hypothetical protein